MPNPFSRRRRRQQIDPGLAQAIAGQLAVRNGWPGRTFNEALALKLGGQVPMVDEPVPEHEVDPRDIADTDHFDA